MNLLRLSAITIAILASMSGWANADGYLDHVKTTLAPSEETSRPPPADLDTTPKPTKRPRSKKTKTTQAPIPSTVALETTSKLPAELTTLIPIEPEATKAPEPEATKAPEPEATKAPEPEATKAPEVATTKKRGPKKPKTPPTLPPVDFDCKNKRDGDYADPKDKCSNKYYACVGGLAREMICASKELVFEPESRRCENREDSVRCTGIRKTTLAPKPTTSRRPRPPPEKLPIDCSKMEDGWFADPEKKCSHIFYSCSNGIGVRFECPGKMYFDQLWARCMAREEVEACKGKRPVSTTPASTIPAPITTKSPMDCSEKPSGYYPDPEKKCSQIYYACSNGDTIKRNCPGDLRFDSITQLCDYEENVFDCTGSTKPPPTTTTAPLPSPASLPSKEFDCVGKRDGGYTPESEKCSHTFFKCIGEVAYKFICAEQTYYDIDSDKCLGWTELFVCSGRSPKPTPTTVKPKPTEKLPIDCSTKEDGDYPDPEKKCSCTYYSCSGSVATRRSCPGGTVWDKELGICDNKDDVPACSGKPRPPKTTTRRPRPTKRPERLSFDCSSKKDGWYEDDKKKCSSIHYACVGGQPTRFECPGDTAFDIEYGQCGYRNEIPKCGGVRPTTTTEEP